MRSLSSGLVLNTPCTSPSNRVLQVVYPSPEEPPPVAAQEIGGRWGPTLSGATAASSNVRRTRFRSYQLRKGRHLTTYPETEFCLAIASVRHTPLASIHQHNISASSCFAVRNASSKIRQTHEMMHDTLQIRNNASRLTQRI
jgi:hypothetical protein